MVVRPTAPRDADAVRAFLTRAFGGPLEAALVERLQADGAMIASLVAEADGQIIGHIAFSRLSIATPARTVDAVALAPMAVAPERQRRGVGSALVREGLRVCREAGEAIVIVVGHPEYYPRFGFSAALALPLRSPYEGDAFMALELRHGALRRVEGEVRYPPAFDSFS